jgi:hypothetical protein
MYDAEIDCSDKLAVYSAASLPFVLEVTCVKTELKALGARKASWTNDLSQS